MHQSIPAAPNLPPPRADPRALAFFFALDGKFPGVGSLELSNPLGWERTCLYNPLQFFPVVDRWANMLYSDRKPCTCQKLGNRPGAGKCPAPRQHKICKCPTSGVVPKSYRPKGQPRSTRNEFPIRADFGNSRKHPIWQLKCGENWQPKELFYHQRNVIYGIVDEVCFYCDFCRVLGPV